jgi:uncharacterized repeat protein (TIGR02543 family)
MCIATYTTVARAATECPYNSTLNGNSCVCDTGYTETDYGISIDLKATAYAQDSTTKYKYNLTTDNGTFIGEVTGQSVTSGSMPLATTPAGASNGTKCWCRLVYPVETSWKYLGGSVNGTAGSDAWFTNCANACGNKLKGSKIQSWFNNGSLVLNDGKVCVASGTPTPTEYTITYNLNSGSGCSNGTYTSSDTVTLCEQPTYTGYTFDGWYDNSNFTGSAITQISSGSTGDKEYWAKWTPNVIYINWQNASQAEIDANNAGSVIYGGNVNTPRSATHIMGKRFIGWRFVNPANQ